MVKVPGGKGKLWGAPPRGAAGAEGGDVHALHLLALAREGGVDALLEELVADAQEGARGAEEDQERRAQTRALQGAARRRDPAGHADGLLRPEHGCDHRLEVGLPDPAKVAPCHLALRVHGARVLDHGGDVVVVEGVARVHAHHLDVGLLQLGHGLLQQLKVDVIADCGDMPEEKLAAAA